MRKEGNIVQKIVEDENMDYSFRRVLRGLHRKRSRSGKRLLAHKKEVLDELKAEIASGTFGISGYREREVFEHGKLRRIQIIPLRDRIGINAIMNVVDKQLRPRMIRTTSASIKGRGMHELMQYISDDIAANPEETLYAYQFDFQKFYESIKQDFAVWCCRRMFKDEKLLTMLEGFIRMMPEGLSIGLRSSQGIGNLLLSVHLDHYLKDQFGVRYFYRYCDDGLALGSSKKDLWKIRDSIHRQGDRMELTVKSNEQVYPITEGIDFLGYVIYPDHVRLRKRNKQNFARKMAEVKSKRRKRELTASFYGMTKHADCRRLFKQLTGIDMKNFKDLGVSYTPADGKKRFKGTVISIRELVNLPIVVHDFETGIKTEQGDDRCIVQIEMNGEMRKFFTNSEEMKNILQTIRDMDDGFPFETTIKAEQFGKNKTKYIFT